MEEDLPIYKFITFTSLHYLAPHHVVLLGSNVYSRFRRPTIFPFYDSFRGNEMILPPMIVLMYGGLRNY